LGFAALLRLLADFLLVFFLVFAGIVISSAFVSVADSSRFFRTTEADRARTLARLGKKIDCVAGDWKRERGINCL
jgi:hypothetical protein